MSMIRDEMSYKVYVEPLVKTVIYQFAQDAEEAGINQAEFLRAVWEWATDELQKLPDEDWQRQRVDANLAAMQDAMIIDGEAG